MDSGHGSPNNYRFTVAVGFITLAVLVALYILPLPTVDTGGTVETDDHVFSYQRPQQRSDEGSPERTSSASLVLSDLSRVSLSSSIDSMIFAPQIPVTEQILPMHEEDSFVKPFPEPLERSLPPSRPDSVHFSYTYHLCMCVPIITKLFV